MLIDRLKIDHVDARMGRRAAENVYLGTLISEIEARAKDDGNRKVTDEDCLTVMEKFKKGAKEILKHDPENAEARQELEWLSQYLPEQLSTSELRRVIIQIKAEQENPNIGSIMKALKERFAGRYDGKTASGVVKESLA